MSCTTWVQFVRTVNIWRVSRPRPAYLVPTAGVLFLSIENAGQIFDLNYGRNCTMDSDGPFERLTAKMEGGRPSEYHTLGIVWRSSPFNLHPP